MSRKWGYRYLLTLGLGDLINGIVKLTVCAYRPWIRSAEIQPAGDSKTAATVVALLGGHWGNLTARFILWFFVVAVWPVCIRKWTKNES